MRSCGEAIQSDRHLTPWLSECVMCTGREPTGPWMGTCVVGTRSSKRASILRLYDNYRRTRYCIACVLSSHTTKYGTDQQGSLSVEAEDAETISREEAGMVPEEYGERRRPNRSTCGASPQKQTRLYRGGRQTCTERRSGA